MAKEKMPFELQRPDANTPVTNATEIDYGSGANRKPLSQVIDDMPNTEEDESENDLRIEDEEGNACIVVGKGELRTGKFNSKKTSCIEEINFPTNTGAKKPVYAISDPSGNHIMEIGEDGHIRTKGFDSSIPSSGGGGSTAPIHPLIGKTLVIIGDSQVGQCANLDTNICKMLPLKYAYRCGFSGCNMAWRNDDYAYFCMYNIADCIASGDFSSMENNLANIGASYRIGYSSSINKLKNIAWGDGKDIIVTIQFGGNDYRMNTQIGSDADIVEGSENTHTMKGSTAYVIRKLLTALPKLTVAFVGQPYRVIAHDGTTIITDSDTTPNSISKYRVDYQDACGEVASKLHIPFFDMYRRSGRNKYNAFQIGNDGCHPTSEFGRQVTAELYCRILNTF